MILLPRSVHNFRMIRFISEMLWPNEIYRDLEKRRSLVEISISLQSSGLLKGNQTNVLMWSATQGAKRFQCAVTCWNRAGSAYHCGPVLTHYDLLTKRLHKKLF